MRCIVHKFYKAYHIVSTTTNPDRREARFEIRDAFQKIPDMEVTDLLDEESVEGNLLLDFLIHTENFRRVANKKLVEETLALIERMTFINEWSETICRDNSVASTLIQIRNY